MRYALVVALYMFAFRRPLRESLGPGVNNKTQFP